MQRTITLTLFIFAISINLTNASVPKDTVGRIWRNGKLFLLHQVELGQTLYSISKQYDTTVTAISQANPALPVKLHPQDTLLIPFSNFKKKNTARTTVATAPNMPVKPQGDTSVATTDKGLYHPSKGGGGTHKVEGGQTLYSIARKYGVSPQDLSEWNQVQGNNIRLGQELIVDEVRSSDNHPEPTNTSLKSDSVAKRPAPVQRLLLPDVARIAPPKLIPANTINEKGLAEAISTGTSADTKYLALHRSAPIGSLVQVTNETNRETIWVKVIGRIPDTSVNDDVVIKLSNRAFEQVSPNSMRFRAKLLYMDTSKKRP